MAFDKIESIGNIDPFRPLISSVQNEKDLICKNLGEYLQSLKHFRDELVHGDEITPLKKEGLISPINPSQVSVYLIFFPVAFNLIRKWDLMQDIDIIRTLIFLAILTNSTEAISSFYNKKDPKQMSLIYIYDWYSRLICQEYLNGHHGVSTGELKENSERLNLLIKAVAGSIKTSI